MAHPHLPLLGLLLCYFSLDLGLFWEAALTVADEKKKSKESKPENNDHINVMQVWGRVVLWCSERLRGLPPSVN